MGSLTSERFRDLAIAALVVAIVAAPLASRAADAGDARDAARQLQAEGLKLLESGQAMAALERFERAYALVASPKILFNLGKARLALGHDVEAFDAFDRFLVEAKDVPPEARAAAERHRDELRPRVALLNFEGERGGAVWLDGRQVGVMPLSRPIVTKPGRHALRLEYDGRVALARTLDLQPGAPVYVLGPGAQPVPAATAEPERAEPKDPAHAGLIEPPAPAAERSAMVLAPAVGADATSTWQRPVGWTLAGGAALALAFGVWKGATAYGSFNDDPTCGRKAPSSGSDACMQLLDDGDRAHRLAIVGYVAAGTLAAASTVLLWLDARARRSDRRWACAIDVTGVGGRCALRF